ncbi:MAG: homocysteine S-methyltransferase family protein [Lachnospirales bacterium]
MDFKTLLNKKDFIILDGAMGTMLQAHGLEVGGIPEELNIDKPDTLIKIHKSYIDAGSDIIYANTFGANSYKLAHSKYSVDKTIKKAIENAKEACKGTDSLVALDIGPIGQLLEPTGTLSFEEAYNIFKEQIIAGKDCDLIVFETMTDLYEVKAAILAAKENSDKPIIVTMTFEDNMRTFTGCCVSSMALTLTGLGVDAIGVNCSLGPKELTPIIEELSKWTNLPLVIKPNAGLPDPVTNKYDVFPEDFSDAISNMVKYGIKFAGGCCGTTPDYISATVKKLENMKYTPQNPVIPAACCTPSKTVIINQPRIIGERINPTGKKLFKEALKNDDIDYILGQAIEQVQGGAEILDVNVGLPDIDEKAMMIKAVKAVQGVVDTPLQIDSTIPEVLEAALKIYNGKPIVNSVNGEINVLESILPIVKKYGACVVGLTLDKNGIPKKAEERFEIAKKIMNEAMEYGIPKQDIFIDCLTLTASAEQEAVMETIKALHRVKEELGLKTVLGVSNISFGLPNRGLINSNFLTMAMTMGLDLPIINPNIEVMTGAVRAYRLLANYDVNSAEFIEAYANTTKPQVSSTHSEHTLDYAIDKGLKAEAKDITKKLLETTDPLEVINNIVVPALDKAGDLFEKGKIFLPQLILSAGVAQEAFEVIKAKILEKGDNSVAKGKIVVATVKGDVHDIGKNIVKVLLENYGYTVIDLGKDVEYETVVDAVKKHKAKLLGLSALMTTTLGSMADTISLVKKEIPNCKIMVGGAVLTPEYAIKIGADFYSKDAKQSVDIAKEVIG